MRVRERVKEKETMRKNVTAKKLGRGKKRARRIFSRDILLQVVVDSFSKTELYFLNLLFSIFLKMFYSEKSF